MGIDWSRIMPKEPIHGLKDVVSEESLIDTLHRLLISENELYL
jgi:hypothetical protein